MDIVTRHVGEEDAFLFQCRLANQTFAKLEAIVYSFALAISITREQLQLRFVLGVGHDVKHAMLGGHNRCKLGENHAPDRQQVLLPLKHAGELGQVCF